MKREREREHILNDDWMSYAKRNIQLCVQSRIRMSWHADLSIMSNMNTYSIFNNQSCEWVLKLWQILIFYFRVKCIHIDFYWSDEKKPDSYLLLNNRLILHTLTSWLSFLTQWQSSFVQGSNLYTKKNKFHMGSLSPNRTGFATW